MINKNELIFAVDENNQPIEPVERRVAHQQGVWHRTTDIVVLNSQGQVLCNRRSALKDTSPGLWDVSFGGHMPPGVTPEAGAILELVEESGLDAKEKDLIFLGIIQHVSKQGMNREFRYCYIYYWEGRAEDVKFEADEIVEVKWFDLETIKPELQDKTKWSPAPYFEMLLDYVKL